ncbi:MAG: helix-turn-helix domain-containing protein [Patescibacteria group bacterium]|nr:helix-turn-helix domain-containing protein [Patescibacteria group bacterium]
MEIPLILRKLGFSDKEIKVYLALLSSGTSSVRKLAKDAELNRSSVHDALKSLRDTGLIAVYQKHKKQYYLAEDPEKLIEVVERREQGIAALKRHVNELLPELKSLYSQRGDRPTVKYYEGMKGLGIVLKDVIATMTELGGDREYRAFSSSYLRQFLYRNFPNFTKERIARQIRGRVLAMGQGSEERPLIEQRRIPTDKAVPTYTFIYGPKVAFISLDEDESPVGVIVEDARIAETQRIIFENAWNVSNIEKRVAMAADIEENL